MTNPSEITPTFQLLPEGFACLKPSLLSEKTQAMRPAQAGKQHFLCVDTYRGVHWVIAMLQAKVLLLCHAQVAVGHIQKRLAQILFLDQKTSSGEMN